MRPRCKMICVRCGDMKDYLEMSGMEVTKLSASRRGQNKSHQLRSDEREWYNTSCLHARSLVFLENHNTQYKFMPVCAPKRWMLLARHETPNPIRNELMRLTCGSCLCSVDLSEHHRKIVSSPCPKQSKHTSRIKAKINRNSENTN